MSDGDVERICDDRGYTGSAPICHVGKVFEAMLLHIRDWTPFFGRGQNCFLRREFLVEVRHVFHMSLWRARELTVKILPTFVSLNTQFAT